MPYIPKEYRPNYDKHIKAMVKAVVEYEQISAKDGIGHLNYIMTAMIHLYADSRGISYSTYNDMIGVLECAKLELYADKIKPYENKAIKKNGAIKI